MQSRVLPPDEDLEAILAGVAGARDVDSVIVERAVRAVVVSERVECAAARGRHHVGRARALERDERVVDAAIDELDLRGRVLGEPLEVLLAIRRVHDEQHVVGAPVHEEVVDDAAARAQHHAVLDAADRKRRDGVRRHAVDERDRPGAAHHELAHVRHVEEPRGAADRLMLGHDARVLERHLPSRERHELPAERGVAVVERRAE